MFHPFNFHGLFFLSMLCLLGLCVQLQRLTAFSSPLFIFHLTFFSEVHQEHPRLLCREAQQGHEGTSVVCHPSDN